MRFVDEVYSLYRDQLNDAEEDPVTLVLSLLEEHTREDIQRLIDEMSEEELFQMMGMYLVEMLKMKMAQEGKIPLWKPSFVPPPSPLKGLKQHRSLPDIR